jgi:hypothetical protein
MITLLITVALANAAVEGLRTTGVAMCGAGVIGVGFSFTIPVLNSTLLLLSPDAFRGRVMSLFAMTHLGFRPVWSLLAGAATSVLGPRLALALLALISGCAMIGVVRSRGATRAPHTE